MKKYLSLTLCLILADTIALTAQTAPPSGCGIYRSDPLISRL